MLCIFMTVLEVSRPYLIPILIGRGNFLYLLDPWTKENLGSRGGYTLGTPQRYAIFAGLNLTCIDMFAEQKHWEYA